MRLRDLGGMIIVDFIDMVLESNRDLVLRRLTESLARDRTRHQVSEVTSLGLVQMTRKRLGTGLLEAFSTTCTHCAGRGLIVHSEPVEVRPSDDTGRDGSSAVAPQESGRADAPAAETKAPAQEHPLFRAMHAHIHENDDVEVVDVSEIEETSDDELVVDEATTVEETSAVETALTVDEVVVADAPAVEAAPAVDESPVVERPRSPWPRLPAARAEPAPKVRHRRSPPGPGLDRFRHDDRHRCRRAR